MKRRKFHLRGERVRDRGIVRRIFEKCERIAAGLIARRPPPDIAGESRTWQETPRIVEIGYYPGCALHGSSNDYEASVRACLAALGVRAARVGRLDLLRRDGRPFAQSHAGRGLAGPEPGHRRARRPGRTAGPLPDVLDGADQGPLRCWPPRRDLRQRDLRDRRTATLRGSTQVLNLIQVFQKIGLEQIKASGGPAAGRFPPGLLLRLPADAAAGDAAVRRLRAAQFDGDAAAATWGASRSSGTTRPSVAGRA